jgi:hypothetical protein
MEKEPGSDLLDLHAASLSFLERNFQVETGNDNGRESHIQT